MSKLPTQHPAPENIAASKGLRDFLASSNKVQEKLGDKYMAVNHMLMACFDQRCPLPRPPVTPMAATHMFCARSDIAKELNHYGLNKDNMEKYLKEVPPGTQTCSEA